MNHHNFYQSLLDELDSGDRCKAIYQHLVDNEEDILARLGKGFTVVINAGDFGIPMFTVDDFHTLKDELYRK